mgnify:CR=1 FL=1|jgi:hypothetical protein
MNDDFYESEPAFAECNKLLDLISSYYKERTSLNEKISDVFTKIGDKFDELSQKEKESINSKMKAIYDEEKKNE